MTEASLLEATRHDVYPFISLDGNLSDAAQSRSVLITGAGTGIGKAIAKAFAQAGAENIVIVARRQSNLDLVKQEIERLVSTCKVFAIAADVSDEDGVETLFAKVKGAGIKLSVLVNSAGVHLDRNPIVKSNIKNWWTAWEISFKGSFITTHFFFKQLEELKSTSGNSIVNVSSAASYAVLPFQTSYGIPKTALNRLTEYTAMEGKRFGVQACCYHPGGIPDTDITSKSPAWMRALYQETVELAANVALYLSTPRASYLNGRYIDARWDLEELETHKEKIVQEDLLKMVVLGAKREPMPDELKKVMDSA